jgi:allophanate hydrolase subunit 2
MGRLAHGGEGRAASGAQEPAARVRSYLAVAGGIAVPKVLGSRSTDLKVGIGGLDGRRLQDGDQLRLGKSEKSFCGPRGVKQLPIGNRIRAARAGVPGVR